MVTLARFPSRHEAEVGGCYVICGQHSELQVSQGFHYLSRLCLKTKITAK